MSFIIGQRKGPLPDGCLPISFGDLDNGFNCEIYISKNGHFLFFKFIHQEDAADTNTCAITFAGLSELLFEANAKVPEVAKQRKKRQKKRAAKKAKLERALLN